MKWLTAGLVLVNVATVASLLLGMAHGGLNRAIAVIALLLGLLVAFAAWFQTFDERRTPAVVVETASPEKTLRRDKKRTAARIERINYRNIWFWLVAAIFAIFAFRSFGWLLFWAGNDWKIQSPNNLGDIALHITHLRDLANGVTLWPDSPIYTFSHLRYPIGTDLFNALFACLHFDLRRNLIWFSLLGALATFYAFWRWGGTFAIAGFLFNGGLAGFQILTTGQWRDYQGIPSIAWKSVPLAMLVTQRGLLYAIPAGLLLLIHWRRKFFPPPNESGEDAPAAPLPFWIECSLYATMPLFHFHTFAALSLLLGCWFLISLRHAARRNQLLLLAGCAVLPATFFVWLITDHFQASSILEWKFGWVQSDGDFAMPFFKFWAVNFGLFGPLVLLLLGLCLWRFRRNVKSFFAELPTSLAFLLPAALLFLFAINVKTAPWYWDNTKLLIWSYFIVLPFLWRDLLKETPVEIRAAVCIALFGSGFVSLFGGLASGQPGYDLADRAEVDAVTAAVRKIPPDARFAAYPTYNHPLLLNGRKVALGYLGHLSSEGFDYGPAEQTLNRLMKGAPDWRQEARHLHTRYLFWGREEKSHYGESTRPWEKSALRVARGPWGEIYDLESDAAAKPLQSGQ